MDNDEFTQLSPAKQRLLDICLDIANNIEEYPEFYLEDQHPFIVDNKAIVMAAVSRKGYGESLEDASPRLQDDVEVVTAAINSYPLAYRFASNRLLNDKELTLMAVKKDGMNLDWTTGKMQDDKDVVIAALTANPYALQYASLRLQDDKELVLLAVEEYPDTIRYASNSIRDLVGDRNPTEAIQKAIHAEKMMARLNNQLRPKPEDREQTRRIKI